MKKLLVILLALVMTLSAFCFVSCDKDDNNNADATAADGTNADGTNANGAATELTFKYSDYYKNSVNFDGYRPYLEQFLNIIKKAYDESDKKTFSTFKLPDNFDTVKKNLDDALAKEVEADADDIDAFLKGTEARTKVNTMFADMLENIGTWQVNDPSTVDESLFKEIDKDLNAFVNELANGKG